MRLNASAVFRFVERLFSHETDFGMFCLGMFAVITIACAAMPVPQDVAMLLRTVRAGFVGFWIVSDKKETLSQSTRVRKVVVKRFVWF